MAGLTISERAREPIRAAATELLRRDGESLPAPERAEEFGTPFARFGDARVVLLGEAAHDVGLGRGVRILLDEIDGRLTIGAAELQHRWPLRRGEGELDAILKALRSADGPPEMKAADRLRGATRAAEAAMASLGAFGRR